MKRHLVKQAVSILLGGVAVLVVLSACGGSTGGNTPVPTAPAATAVLQSTTAPSPSPTARPAPSPTATTLASSQPTPGSASGTTADLLSKEKLIFEKTAGGLGCAYCHGLGGRGDGPAKVNAANIRGATEVQVRNAIAGGVPMMEFIKLSDAEIEAVVAYLQYLDEQP